MSKPEGAAVKARYEAHMKLVKLSRFFDSVRLWRRPVLSLKWRHRANRCLAIYSDTYPAIGEK